VLRVTGEIDERPCYRLPHRDRSSRDAVRISGDAEIKQSGRASPQILPKMPQSHPWSLNQIGGECHLHLEKAPTGELIDPLILVLSGAGVSMKSVSMAVLYWVLQYRRGLSEKTKRPTAPGT
jgi:hypothetical protein